MKTFFIVFLLAFSLCAGAAELPEQIVLKSDTQSFTHEYDVVLFEGKIWHRPRAAENPQAWTLLGKTGLPGNASSQSSQSRKSVYPASVTKISADGDNLIATGPDGRVYYMKWGSRKWMNTWGKPVAKPLALPESIRAFAISHRGPFAAGYSDIDGHFHPVSVGVTTLYLLSDDGLTISYADPWLPAGFSYRICGPERNRFRARSLSASASTLFVINDAGEMYTRLADFDTLGCNPVLAYSYARGEKDRNPPRRDVRTLPPEAWKKQPSIPQSLGRITSAITIFQTGTGNAARELRVEGVDASGAHGYFFKPIDDGTWHFTRTDLPLLKSFLALEADPSDLGPALDRTLSGRLRTRSFPDAGDYDILLKNFNPPCDSSTLSLVLGAEEIEFPVYLTATSPHDRHMKGALFILAEHKAKAAGNPSLNDFVQAVFGNNEFVQIRLTVTKKDQALISIY
ncbi:MAG: hypothetical protein R6W75_00195 [Smithellaceae bacterium]